MQSLVDLGYGYKYYRCNTTTKLGYETLGYDNGTWLRMLGYRYKHYRCNINQTLGYEMTVLGYEMTVLGYEMTVLGYAMMLGYDAWLRDKAWLRDYEACLLKAKPHNAMSHYGVNIISNIFIRTHRFESLCLLRLTDYR